MKQNNTKRSHLSYKDRTMANHCDGNQTVGARRTTSQQREKSNGAVEKWRRREEEKVGHEEQWQIGWGEGRVRTGEKEDQRKGLG